MVPPLKPLVLALSLAASGLAAPQQDTPLDRRAKETAALFVADPEWPEGHFSAAFLTAVPAARMVTILRGVHSSF